MITIDKITNHEGLEIDVNKIITLNPITKKLQAGNISIDLNLGSIDNGGNSGGTTPPTDKTIVEDDLYSLVPSAFTDNGGNDEQGEITLTQEQGENNWEKFQFTTEELWTPSSGNATSIKEIKLTVKDSGYQIAKILMFDKNGDMIRYLYGGNSQDNNVSKSDGSNTAVVTHQGFLTTISTYALENIITTDNLPLANQSNWFAITQQASHVNIVFDTPEEVSSIRVYRCGTQTTFNKGTLPYDVEITDSSGTKQNFDVPKLSDAEFADINNFSSHTLSGSGGDVDSSTDFTISVSEDNSVWNTLQNPQKTTVDSGAKKKTNISFNDFIPSSSVNKLYVRSTYFNKLVNLKIKTFNAE